MINVLIKNIVRSTGRIAIFPQAKRCLSQTSVKRISLKPIVDEPNLNEFGETFEYTQHEEIPYREPPTTIINDPRQHTVDHLSLWYKIPEDEYKRYFGDSFIMPLQYVKMLEVFEGGALMIRRPAVSVIQHLKQMDLSTMTPPKFIFYGRDGCGKTMCLNHVVHYLASSGHVLLQVPDVNRWINQLIKTPNELTPSTHLPGKFDVIKDAVSWLKLFTRQNSPLLEQLELTMTRDLQMSTREGVKTGDPLIALAELGVSRPNLAASCVYEIFRELKTLASLNRCRVACVMDSVNALFSHTTAYKHEDRSPVSADEMTLVTAVRQMLDNDWTNGVIVGTVDNKVLPFEKRGSGLTWNDIGPSYRHRKRNLLERRPQPYTPRRLLGPYGWTVMDPMLAIPVPEYSRAEMLSALHFYASASWISNPAVLTEEGVEHLAFCTNSNPFFLSHSVACL